MAATTATTSKSTSPIHAKAATIASPTSTSTAPTLPATTTTAASPVAPIGSGPLPPSSGARGAEGSLGSPERSLGRHYYSDSLSSKLPSLPSALGARTGRFGGADGWRQSAMPHEQHRRIRPPSVASGGIDASGGMSGVGAPVLGFGAVHGCGGSDIARHSSNWPSAIQLGGSAGIATPTVDPWTSSSNSSFGGIGFGCGSSAAATATAATCDGDDGTGGDVWLMRAYRIYRQQQLELLNSGT
eukprot:TRINITY_DN9621_c0_g3_i1.p1 TRINITY_DN9621_c0_g3~~TRINITY_DN9621_c0_g3_i1.p1  ORF type:complete len:256 (+),score=78.08 TRINITY_DN9621_c0_g3_i1:42-770(+)